MAKRSGSEAAELVDEKKDYKVICICLYTEDLERLDEKVKALRGRGYRRANRSALIRHALDTVDLTSVPRGI